MNSYVLENPEELKKALHKFLNSLLNEINFQRKNQEDIAKELGIKGGSFSKNLSGKSQFGFWNMIKLLNILYGDDVQKKRKLLHEFCLLTTNKQNMRIAMEYANAIGDLSLLKKVVDKERNSSLAINKEWSYVYELVWIRSSEKVKGNELLKLLEERKKSRAIKTTEMKVLYNILTFYTMYDLGKFNSLFDYAEVLQPEIDEIKDEFINTCYSNRVKEGLSYAYLIRDEIDKSRELCHEILNAEDKYNCLSLLKASASVYIGESFAFESYSRPSWYMKKSLEFLTDQHLERVVKRRGSVLNTYSFVKLIHRKNLDDLQIYDVGEEALAKAVLGNVKGAVKLLENEMKVTGRLSPMKKCYLGYALNSSELLRESIMDFEKESNYFYSKLPRKMLVEINKNGIIYMGDAK